MPCAQPGSRRGRCTRPAGRTATTNHAGRGLLRWRVALSRRLRAGARSWTAAGLPVRPSRAILVHSRLVRRPAPDDAVISEDGAVTFLNQTARYAPVRSLRVLVREPDGSPAAGAEVTFGIVNASQIFPAAVIRTDSRGAAQLVCGYGDLALQSRKSGWSCEALCPGRAADARADARRSQKRRPAAGKRSRSTRRRRSCPRGSRPTGRKSARRRAAGISE